jgi:hypothetical protein
MKIIINERQLRQIVESENKKKLMSISTELFYNKVDVILDNYKKKGFDGIKLDGDLNLGKLDVEDIEKILNEVVIVTGNLDLRNTDITTLGKLESVGGDFNLTYTLIESLGNLKEVGGYLSLRETSITSLGNLEKVGDALYLQGAPITSLGELKSVGHDLDLDSSKIKSLGNLKSVGHNLYLRRTPLGKKLKESGMSEDEIKNKFEVKGNLYL